MCTPAIKDFDILINFLAYSRAFLCSSRNLFCMKSGFRFCAKSILDVMQLFSFLASFPTTGGWFCATENLRVGRKHYTGCRADFVDFFTLSLLEIFFNKYTTLKYKHWKLFWTCNIYVFSKWMQFFCNWLTW